MSNLDDILNLYSITTDLDPIVVKKVAAVALVSGDVCYQNSSGKMDKADANALATISGPIYMCNATISLDAEGEFIQGGSFVTTGLTAGNDYWVSTTAGAITSTQPSTIGEFIRYVGRAESTTVLDFRPTSIWIEIT